MLDQLSAWRDFLTAQGKAELTIFGYGWELEKFCAWASALTPPVMRAEHVTPEVLQKYIVKRREERASDATVKRCSSALRVFFRWALGAARSPAETLPLPRRLRRVRARRWFTQVRTDEILAGFDTSAPLGKRDAALFQLMLCSGIRAAEVCRARLAEVNLTELHLFVRVKGGQTAIVFFTEDAAALINDWLSVRPSLAREGVETLFVSVGGIKPGTPLTTNGLRAIFRYIGERHGIKFSPHDLRRTGASQFLNNGGNTRQLMEVWRLKTLEDAERYTQFLDMERARQYLPRPTKRS